MPEDEGSQRDGPQRRDLMATVGEWLRSTELFNWVILIGFVLIASILLARLPLALFVLSLGFFAASAYRWGRLGDRKWGIALLIAGIVIFPYPILSDPSMLTRNG